MNILITKNISKSFGGVMAVNNVSLEIEQRKIYSLIGPNCAGKTTFFNLFSGFLMPDDGEIIFKGEIINHLDPYKRAEYFSRTFQLTRNFNNLTLKNNLLLSFDSEYENIFKFWKFKEKFEKEKIEITREMLKEIKFTRELNVLAKEISFGEAKLIELIRAILKHHELLILDKSVGGVNPEIREIIKDILKKLKDQGDTVFILIPVRLLF